MDGRAAASGSGDGSWGSALAEPAGEGTIKGPGVRGETRQPLRAQKPKPHCWLHAVAGQIRLQRLHYTHFARQRSDACGRRRGRSGLQADSAEVAQPP